MRGVKPGDLVVYVRDPNGLDLYGRMEFKGPREDGDPRFLECIACPGSSHAHSYWFEEHELKLASKVAA